MKTDLVEVDFHGSTLIAKKGGSPADTLVAMKPVVEGIGLDWKNQHEKIVGHPVLSTCMVLTTMQMPGDDQAREVTMLPLNRLNFWLATIQPNRIKDPATRAKVIEYQTECADVLFDHFFGKAMGAPELDRQSNGILRSTIHKVTGMEKDIAALREGNRLLLEQVQSMMAIADRHLAVSTGFMTVLDVLKKEKVPQKGRDRINKALGFSFRARALLENSNTRQDAKGTWMFRVEDVARWMKEFGRDMIKTHQERLEQENGQGVISLTGGKLIARPTIPLSASALAQAIAEAPRLKDASLDDYVSSIMSTYLKIILRRPGRKAA